MAGAVGHDRGRTSVDADEQPGADAVILGRVSGVYGVKGWVKVYSYTDPREGILDYRRWWLRHDSDWQGTDIRQGKRHGKTVIASLEGVDDPDTASELIGCDIAVPRAALAEPGDGRYYWRDLEGMAVRHRDGTELGRVAYVMETGANDVLVIEGDSERLIPFVADEVILDVDLRERVISVDWEWD